MLTELDNNHIAKALSDFPPESIKILRNLTKEQNFYWLEARNKWIFLTKQLDYLQQIQAGYMPQPPLEQLDPAHKAGCEVEANRLFAELNLMISGWDLIKAASKNCQRDFNFASPRDLFIEACRQEAILMCSHFLSYGDYTGVSLSQTRNYYTNSNAFYRGRLDPKDNKSWLEAHQSCQHWFRFMIYAIWDKRLDKTFNQGKLAYDWQYFLKAYKADTQQVCDKKYFLKYGCKVVAPLWRNGKVFDYQNKSPLTFKNTK